MSEFFISYTLPDGMKCNDMTLDMATAVVHWREVVKKHPDCNVLLIYRGEAYKKGSNAEGFVCMKKDIHC